MSDAMVHKDGEGAVVLSEELLLQLKNDARDTYPFECCGLLFGNITDDGITVIKEVVRIENRDSRRKHYGIDPLELLKSEKDQKVKGNEIVGSYHSHPDQPAIPSEEDIREMIPEMIYLILSVSEENVGRSRAWRKGRSSDLVRESRIYKS